MPSPAPPGWCERMAGKNTPSAKRRLRKRRRKEARRARDINHKIAKHVVAEAERTGRGIALEDLTGIRGRVRLRKPGGTSHALQAVGEGHPLLLGLLPAGSVHRVQGPPGRSAAGVRRSRVHLAHLRRVRPHRQANRASQAWFACRNCGFVDHADRNGSRNIRARAWELWRRVAPSTAPAPPRTPRSGAGRKRSITASDTRCASPAL
jgi:transposase